MPAVEPGRCGEHWDDCPRLAAGDRFDFACAGCGDCCRQRRDLVLSGYDLYRIARRLSLPPRIVAAAFCKSYLAPESCLPALRLTPDPKTGNCRFFEGSACTIHAAPAGLCALPAGAEHRHGDSADGILRPDAALRCTGRGGTDAAGLSAGFRRAGPRGGGCPLGHRLHAAFPPVTGRGRRG